MFLEITGFLPPDNEDDFIKFSLDISPENEPRVMDVLGWKSLEAEIAGDLQLTVAQAEKISSVIDELLPRDLDLFIGVRS
ncbi:hypothetical protein EGJ27_14790 [Pseudomonas sp. v388]|uniref:pyocin S6 family toxin immunity protein n=1 Tax=Pseudomonas sp. v388 TaxID=2479849 RepID=UPI000F76E73E|nr:pyocin S6 family toxin immunity protein [Pseudomonas sp. v388]RRV07009.1 hypothetical protein EGJ27_14790 [Pseudomonas sp. v388]